MGPLRTDFEWNREHELIIEAEDGLQREELDELELSMLENSLPPGFLPVEWQTWNGQIRFRYLLSGRRMLKQRLLEKDREVQSFYNLMLAIAAACQECRNYMLRADNLLLDENHLFIGESWSDIGLVYVPMKASPAAVTPLRLRMLALAVRASTGLMPSEQLAAVIQAIGDESISIQKLSSMLQAAAATHSAVGNESARVNSSKRSFGGENGKREEGFSRHGEASAKREKSELSMAGSWNKMAAMKSLRGSGHPGEKGGEDSYAAGMLAAGERRLSRNADEHPEALLEPSLDSEAGMGKKPNKWIVVAAIAAVAALPWKVLYWPDKDNGSLFICCGITAAAAGILLWFLSKGGGNGLQGEKEVDLFVPESGEVGIVSRWRDFHDASDGQAGPESSGRGREKAVKTADADFKAAFHRNEGMDLKERKQHSIPVARPGDRTEWLGAADPADPNPMTPKPVHSLIRVRNGKTESLAVVSAIYQIGRDQDVVDCLDDSAGVSRIHLELAAGSEGCTAKDLGSRNGSTLNGRTMIPYKAYKLENGDVLQLAGAGGYAYEYVAASGAARNSKEPAPSLVNVQ